MTESRDIIICNKCNNLMAHDLQVEELGKGIQRAYMECGVCGATYTAYYSDARLRASMKELSRVRAWLEKSVTQEQYNERRDILEHKSAKAKELMEKIGASFK